MSQNTIVSRQHENTKPPFSRFDLATRHARISVMAERDYWPADATTDPGDLVRVSGDDDAPMLLTPVEALSVAAALQAVAVDMLEQQPRELHRTTEPGAPAFEEAL